MLADVIYKLQVCLQPHHCWTPADEATVSGQLLFLGQIMKVIAHVDMDAFYTQGTLCLISPGLL